MFLGVVAIVSRALPATAQDQADTVDIAALAEAAERAPLFASHDPLTVTLEADIDNLKDERDEALERVGTLTFPGPDGQPMSVGVKLTTRGIFRLDKQNCNFPPLRLDLPKEEVAATVFDGQNRLKMVAPCHDSRDEYQRYVLLEYLVYRTYNLITPVSFRVRLMHVTLKDTSGENEDRTRYVFLIEDVDRLAERHLAEESEWEEFHPLNMEGRQATITAVFQFMIGNADWSAPYFHNIKMIMAEGPTFLVVPFDFDASGAVEASYAPVRSDLGLRRVRDRLFRGFCRDGLDYESIYALFNEHKEAIYSMVRGFEPLEERQRDRLLDYYDDFYDIINNNGRARNQISGACRNLG
jgi:hypothetical protein